jgi:hypothetical protein
LASNDTALPVAQPEEADDARSPQTRAALELRRLGRARDDTLQLATAATGHAQAKLLDLELALGANERQPHIADGLAADIGLIDGKSRRERPSMAAGRACPWQGE